MSIEIPKELPIELQDALRHFNPDVHDAASIGQDLVDWLDGRHPDDLDQVLGCLRDMGAYPISLVVLEAGWNADLPEDRLGRIAEDWIGTVLFGVGDRQGAEEVARHILKTSSKHGPSFENDLGQLLLEWQMYGVAQPIVAAAADALPGDMSAQFNLGIISKLTGDWATARIAFERVLSHRGDEKALQWNLGITYTALGDFVAARTAWRAVGFQMPDGEDDYAAEGDLTPVRLSSDKGPSEVLWGTRLCPARVRIKGIPVLTTDVGYGDEVLVDGVPDGEVPREGSNVPVFNVLEILRRAERATLYLEQGPDWTPEAVGAIMKSLDKEGIPWADWRPMSELTPYPIAISVLRSELTPDSVWANVSLQSSSIGRWISAQPVITPTPGAVSRK